MHKLNYSHNVIRLHKGKQSRALVYSIIAILNKKKTNSYKIVEKLGFFKYGDNCLLSINYKNLANSLNKGFVLKSSVKKLIFYNTLK